MAKSVWVEDRAGLGSYMRRGYIPVAEITIAAQFEPFMSREEMELEEHKMEVRAMRMERKLHHLLAGEDAIIAIVRRMRTKTDVWKKGTRKGRYRIVAVQKITMPVPEETIVVMARKDRQDKVVEKIAGVL